MDISQLIQNISIYAIPVLLSITLHEAAHGYVARHFGDILGVDSVACQFALDDQRLLQGGGVLGFGNETEFVHAAQNIFLAELGAVWIDDRIVGRWRLGQTGQHGGLGDRDVLEWLAEIDLGGCSKTIGALPKEDLIDVQLENLVLAQAALDLEGE